MGISGRIWAYLGISGHIWAYLGVSVFFCFFLFVFRSSVFSVFSGVFCFFRLLHSPPLLSRVCACHFSKAALHMSSVRVDAHEFLTDNAFQLHKAQFVKLDPTFWAS